jgi:anaerobic selenocysteine-containing dehydrogenase
MAKKPPPMQITDNEWIFTQCGRCYACCGIRVHRINGVAVKIDGNPDTWMGSRGGVCGKGASGLQVLYDPNRLNVPLRRTNPEKGLFADPKWKEISWDEALEEMTARIKKIMADDPRKILLQGTTIRAPTQSQAFRNPVGSVLGTPKAGGRSPGPRHEDGRL